MIYLKIKLYRFPFGGFYFPQSKGRNMNKTPADIMKAEATITANISRPVSHVRPTRKTLSGILFFMGG